MLPMLVHLVECQIMSITSRKLFIVTIVLIIIMTCICVHYIYRSIGVRSSDLQAKIITFNKDELGMYEVWCTHVQCTAKAELLYTWAEGIQWNPSNQDTPKSVLIIEIFTKSHIIMELT